MPQASQIADCWHLLTNLRQAIERHLSRHYRTIRQLVTKAGCTNQSLLWREIVEQA